MSLAYLIDKHEIEQLYIRYCEFVDTKRFDSMAEIFTPDCRGDYTQSMPGVIVPDRASLIAAMHRNLGPGSNCGPTHHSVGNFQIAVDGDTATARVNYHAEHLGQNDLPGELYSMWGRYHDDLVRTAEGWRVSNRIYLRDIVVGQRVTTPAGAPVA